MKFNQGTANEISKWFLFVLLFIVFGGGFLGFGLWMLLEGELIGLLILLYALFWLYMMSVAFYSMAGVTLSNDGVYVRVFIKRKHYSWNEIVQAGVLWRKIKYRYYNELVLLPKAGVPGNPRDKLFMFRNQFHLIHIPYTPDTISFVLFHYGPLDFDFSDGKGIKKQ